MKFYKYDGEAFLEIITEDGTILYAKGINQNLGKKHSLRFMKSCEELTKEEFEKYKEILVRNYLLYG